MDTKFLWTKQFPIKNLRRDAMEASNVCLVRASKVNQDTLFGHETTCVRLNKVDIIIAHIANLITKNVLSV